MDSIKAYEIVVHTEKEVKDVLREGDRVKDRLPVVKGTPISHLLDVRYEKLGKNYHSYYLYDPSLDKCVGVFSLEGTKRPKNFPIAKVPVFIPHMDLSPQWRGKGIASLCYSSFLLKKPFLFLTDHHSKDASKLWDRLSNIPKLTSRYAETKEETYRLLGRKKFFQR